MYRLLEPRGSQDQSPLKFFRVEWLRSQYRGALERYRDYHQSAPLRVESNHLLISMLNGIDVPFDGDLYTYMSKVDRQVRRISGAFKLTTPQVRGKEYTGVFYKGATEVITLSRGDYELIDLWWGWRVVSPVTVSSHPFTNTDLLTPGVMNRPEGEGLVYINVDIPLLAGQYRMYRATYPDGTVERFMSQYVFPGMITSHMDQVLFNHVMVEFGLLEPQPMKTNLPINQADYTPQYRELAQQIHKDLLSRSLTPTQILDTVPSPIRDAKVLEVTKRPDMLVTANSVWAVHSQAIRKAVFVLKVCHDRDAYERVLPLLTRIQRDGIQMLQEGWYRNGLSSTLRKQLSLEWERVIGLVPSDYKESLESHLQEFFYTL